MRAGIDIGIDPQRARRHLAPRGGQGSQLDAFFLAFDVELTDPGVQPLDHFVRLLADA